MAAHGFERDAELFPVGIVSLQFVDGEAVDDRSFAARRESGDDVDAVGYGIRFECRDQVAPDWLREVVEGERAHDSGVVGIVAVQVAYRVSDVFLEDSDAVSVGLFGGFVSELLEDVCASVDGDHVVATCGQEEHVAAFAAAEVQDVAWRDFRPVFPDYGCRFAHESWEERVFMKVTGRMNHRIPVTAGNFTEKRPSCI